MKFAERVASFLKSLGADGEDDKEKKNKEEGKEDDINLDDLDGDEGGAGEGGSEEGDGEMEKSEYADATELMTALVGELKTLNKSIQALSKKQDSMEKSYNDLGEAIVDVAEMVSKIGNRPNSVKSAMLKSLAGSGTAGAPAAAGVLTQEEFVKARNALIKSCAKKEITIFQSSHLESEMQKAMNVPGYQMSQADRAVIISAMKTA